MGANAYSKLYFKTKIKPIVEERWKAEYLKKNPDHKPGDKIPRWKITFQNAILHEMWKAEPDTVKNDVRDQFGLNEEDTDDEEAEPDEPEEGDGADRDELERVERAKGYQTCVSPVSALAYSNHPHSSNIDVLNEMMMTALREIERKTGFIGTVLLASPKPAQGGNISVFEYVGHYTFGIDSTHRRSRIHKGRSQYSAKDLELVYRALRTSVNRSMSLLRGPSVSWPMLYSVGGLSLTTICSPLCG